MPEAGPRNYNIFWARVQGVFLMTGLGAIAGALLGSIAFEDIDWKEGALFGGVGGLAVVGFIFYQAR